MLDIADGCMNEPETFNGYLDGDGCPDVLPDDLVGVRGVIAGVLYPELASDVNESARANLARIAKVLAAYPATKIVLVGYTDSIEPTQLAADGEAGDPEVLAEGLGLARAEGMKHALVEAGVDAARISVEGRGGQDPIGPDTTPRERLVNRRVELKIFVAPH